MALVYIIDEFDTKDLIDELKKRGKWPKVTETNDGAWFAQQLRNAFYARNVSDFEAVLTASLDCFYIGDSAFEDAL